MRRRVDPLIRGLALASLLLAAPGCTLGPNYVRPPIEPPAAFKSRPATQPAPPIPEAWWRLYNDPQLDQLVAMANDSNQSLRQALAGVDQARALARVAGSYRLPTVTADPNASRVRTSANKASATTGKPTQASVAYNDWQIPFDLAYEIDIWGRVRRLVEASTADAAATTDDLAVVQLTVATDVATYYYTLRALDAQEQILEQTVTGYAEQVRIVSAQLRNGLVGPIDLDQAQALLEATHAQLRDVQRARADEEHALAVLCGRPAPSFSVPADPLLEAAPPEVPSGLPAQLLTRRPDVAEAEQKVVSFNAQVGVATAELYPTFSLTGTVGFESASFTHILDWKSKVAAIGARMFAPIFEGGRLRANLAAVKAQYQQAVAGYLNQVLVAYQDVEDALTDLSALTEEADRMRAAVAASEEYLRLARVQYKQGLATYLIVIDAERTLLANQLILSRDINQQMAASIHLIKALGGGWDQETLALQPIDPQRVQM
jgi:multidrug efflux system outer membrane protein